MCVCVRALTLPRPLRHFRGFDGLFGRTRAFLLEAVRGHSFAEFLCADHRAMSGGGTEEGKVTGVSPTCLGSPGTRMTPARRGQWTEV